MKRIAVLGVVLMLGACREGVAPYELPEFAADDSTLVQLTFGGGQDRDPHWTAGGDSILYHTSSTDALPGVIGALMRISMTGGTARAVFEQVQRLRPNLAIAVPSPSGDRIAYVEIARLDEPHPCTSTVEPVVCALRQPLLDSIVVRVRRVAETGSHTQDPSIGVRVQGTSFDQTDAPYFQNVYPFQAQHREEDALLFRPSWSPDNQRIAFSDGLRILIWQVGAASATMLPGSENGVSPAWSPDGTRIAFTVLERGDSSLVTCGCSLGPRGFAAFRRVYTVTARRLVVMRTDGSESVQLGEGEDPAWSPDGQSIYAKRGISISRISYPSGNAVVIPGTEFSRTPAVSPDGRWLAFARTKLLPAAPPLLKSVYDWDIWLARLSQ